MTQIYPEKTEKWTKGRIRAMSLILNPTTQQLIITSFKIVASIVPVKTVTQKNITDLWNYGQTKSSTCIAPLFQRGAIISLKMREDQ